MDITQLCPSHLSREHFALEPELAMSSEGEGESGTVHEVLSRLRGRRFGRCHAWDERCESAVIRAALAEHVLKMYSANANMKAEMLLRSAPRRMRGELISATAACQGWHVDDSRDPALVYFNSSHNSAMENAQADPKRSSGYRCCHTFLSVVRSHRGEMSESESSWRDRVLDYCVSDNDINMCAQAHDELLGDCFHVVRVSGIRTRLVHKDVEQGRGATTCRGLCSFAFVREI